jgi:hypothetical protein
MKPYLITLVGLLSAYNASAIDNFQIINSTYGGKPMTVLRCDTADRVAFQKELKMTPENNLGGLFIKENAGTEVFLGKNGVDRVATTDSNDPYIYNHYQHIGVAPNFYFMTLRRSSGEYVTFPIQTSNRSLFDGGYTLGDRPICGFSLDDILKHCEELKCTHGWDVSAAVDVNREVAATTGCPSRNNDTKRKETEITSKSNRPAATGGVSTTGDDQAAACR